MNNETTQTLETAIIAGLTHAAKCGFTKPADIATAVQVAIKDAGLTVRRIPTIANENK